MTDVIKTFSSNGRWPITAPGIGMESSRALDNGQTNINIEFYSRTNKGAKLCLSKTQKVARDANLARGTLEGKNSTIIIIIIIIFSQFIKFLV
jgi:hypothetical protein